MLPFWSVNVTCLNLLSFICRCHLLDHFSIRRRCVCKLLIASVICVCRDRMAVSSANVLRGVVVCCGTSAVYSAYRNGPSTLPCGTRFH